MNCRTGAVKSFSAEEIAEKFQVEKNIQYTPKEYKDVDEYFALKQQVEDAYLTLRKEVLEKGSLESSQSQYMQAVCNFVSPEIVENVYRKLNKTLFK